MNSRADRSLSSRLEPSWNHCPRREDWKWFCTRSRHSSGFPSYKMAGSVMVLNNKLFQELFWKRFKSKSWCLDTFITCIESFCIICSKIAIIRHKETRLVMSSQDRRKRSSPRTSSSSSRSTESLSGHSSEKNQHRENCSGRKNNSGKVRT